MKIKYTEESPAFFNKHINDFKILIVTATKIEKEILQQNLKPISGKSELVKVTIGSKTYFTSVIDWVSTVFKDVESEMRGLEWGRLYETYKKQPYSPQKVSQQVKELYSDSYIKNRKGVFEYILGGSTDTKLLEVRVFDEATKKSVYAKQKTEAEKKGISNCPLCAVGNNANKNKIWALAEMDADHVSAWSKGGATDIKNCEMLCKTHNRAKGNK